MKLIWSNNRLIAHTKGDVVWGIAMFGVALWLGAYAGNHWVSNGFGNDPLPALAGLVVVFFGPIGLHLIFTYRRLEIDFEAQAFRFHDGLLGKGHSRSGRLDEIATIQVETFTWVYEKGLKVFLFPPGISHRSREFRRMKYSSVVIPDLLPGGLAIPHACNERYIAQLIEQFTSRYPFEVQANNEIVYV